MSKAETESYEEPNEHGIFFFICLTIGWLIIGFGVVSMVQNKGLTNPRYTFELALGANIFHDAILAPAVCVVGYLVSKLLPESIRRIFFWGVFSSAVLALIAYPAIRGTGRKTDNPTVLPLNYATSLIQVLCVVWAIVIVAIIVRVVSNRRTQSQPIQVEVPSE